MKRYVIWILNHEPNTDQINDLSCPGDDVEIVKLSEEGAKLWNQVDPEMGTKETMELAARVARTISLPIKNLKNGQNNVWAVVQGQAGIQTAMVQLLQRACIPCFYATTRRESVETVAADGTTTKTSVFKHVKFIEYPDIAATYAAHAHSPLEAENPFLPKED